MIIFIITIKSIIIISCIRRSGIYRSKVKDVPKSFRSQQFLVKTGIDNKIENKIEDIIENENRNRECMREGDSVRGRRG